MSRTDHEQTPRPAVAGPWDHFLELARPRLDVNHFKPFICLDPGETTGWAVFDRCDLVECGQWATPSPADLATGIASIKEVYPDLDMIVYEEYRVRGNKFKEHVGSEVVTIQHIGAIKVVAAQLGLSVRKQTPGMAKGFATDRKLRQWVLYQVNKRHANDAIRHGCYFILFYLGREA